MSQLYNIYQEQTFLLAKTLVMKFDFISTAMNRELTMMGFHIEEDQSKHRYYMHLAGLYHPFDHMQLEHQTGHDHIQIYVANDNGYELVDFTRELFHGVNGNISLLNEYQYGSDYYNKLVQKYPVFESLIKGIINPIDPEITIPAKNGTVLSLAYHTLTKTPNGLKHCVPDDLNGIHITKLIEPQEGSLIIQIQQWIERMIFRWFNAGYTLTDDLYVPYFLGILYSQLPAKIMNIRLKNTHTSEACMFHIRAYLESHGLLGKYVDVIPFKQVMYLYRNIRYLELNMGKDFTFQEVIKNILTPLGVPLAGYTVNHDITELGIDGRLVPDPKLERDHINFKSLGASSDWKTVREVLDKQIPLAKDNGLYLDQIEIETEETISWGGDDNLYTKVLESELLEIADVSPIEISSMAIWLWGYTASNGWYRGHVFVDNPVAEQRISFTPLNALITTIYCLNLGLRGYKMSHVPRTDIDVNWIPTSFDTEYVPKQGGYQPALTLEQHKEKLVYHQGELPDEVIQDIMGNTSTRYSVNTPKEFYSMVRKHHQELTRKFFTVAKVEDLYERGEAQAVFHECYWHKVPLELVNRDMTYNEFIQQLGIDFSGYTREDYYTLATRLINACVNDSDEYEFNMSEVQRAALAILKHFTSYTVHVIHSINEQSVTNTLGIYPRIGDIEVDGEGMLEGGIHIDLDVICSEGFIEIESDISVTLPVVGHQIEPLVLGELELDWLPTISGGYLDYEENFLVHDVNLADDKLTVVEVAQPPKPIRAPQPNKIMKFIKLVSPEPADIDENVYYTTEYGGRLIPDFVTYVNITYD